MHGWNWVREATMRPQRCAVFPHVNSGAFIDTGIVINTWDPHVYIGSQAAEELGKFVGMVPGEQLRAAEKQLQQEYERIAELEAEIARLQDFKNAVELIKAEI